MRCNPQFAVAFSQTCCRHFSPRRSMFVRHRLAAGTGVIALGAALALTGAAVPASAHSGTFYTSAWSAEAEAGGFATINQANGALALLPQPAGVFAYAVELWNEPGYALVGGDGESPETFVPWDHTTGAITASLAMTLNPDFAETAILRDVGSLDTTTGSTLPDGTILTIAWIGFSDEDPDYIEPWLSAIAPATGVVSPLVDLTGFV